MKVTTETLADRQVVLNIEVDGTDVEDSLNQTYKKLVQRVRIPGFRPGKAPRAILQSYLGKDAMLDEALDELAPKVVKKAIEEQKLDTIDNPEVEVVERSPLILKATVPLQPVVQLADYKSIRLEQEKVEVTPEQVENALEDIRFRQAPWQPVDRPVVFGDLLTIDVEGKVGAKTIINEKGASYIPQTGSTDMVPGFAEQLEEMKKSETKQFSLTIPEDYPAANVGGKESQFSVTVHEIREKNPALLDDDFARSLGDEYDDLKMLREKIASDMNLHAEEEARGKYEDKIVEALKEGAKVEAPPILREREIDHMIMDQARGLASQGIKFDNYLKALDKSAEQLREDYKDAADKRVIASLLLNKVAETEGINVDNKEVGEEIESIAESSGGQTEEVKGQLQTEHAQSSVKQSILMRKTLNVLKEIASGKTASAVVSSGPISVSDKKGEIEDESK